MTLGLLIKYNIKLAEMICDKLDIDYASVKETFREQDIASRKAYKEEQAEREARRKQREENRKPEPMSDAVRATTELSFINWTRLEQERYRAFDECRMNGGNPLEVERLRREYYEAIRKVAELSKKLEESPSA